MILIAILIERFYKTRSINYPLSWIGLPSTTQYNGVNVLDGSYGNKVFQIGANAGQTMNISIGSMSSQVLGVATSNSASVASSSTIVPSTSTTTVTSGGATGRYGSYSNRCEFGILEQFWVKMLTFTIVDSNSGLTAEVSTLTVDMTNSVSKDAFVAAIKFKCCYRADGHYSYRSKRILFNHRRNFRFNKFCKLRKS